jgi:3-deoxy-D-manno-octulosonic-acid transferase
MKFLYTWAIWSYGLLIKIAALYHPKAKKWVQGRKGLFDRLAKADIKNAIWIHAASLGEFEQGRPIIEAIRLKNPNQKILLTFYSPSGYEIKKNYKGVDLVSYMPLDTPRNAKQFIEIVQPKCAIFIKYEFWHHHIRALAHYKIPIYSVSALFRTDQIFFQWYGQFFKQSLHFFKYIFVQNQTSLDVLLDKGISNCLVAGDTRVDRVWDIRQQAKIFPLIETFSKGHEVLIAGSTWQTDEAILIEFCKEYQPNLPFKIIIAPHEINENHIQSLIRKIPIELDVVRYSNSKNLNVSEAEIMIIDNIGMLNAIYRYGKWAYIGGAFGAGLHNTLEPIAFGLPVVFGKKHQKFEEARWLVQHQGGFSIKDYQSFKNIMNQLSKAEFYNLASKKALTYIEQNRGASEIIMDKMEL